MRIFRWLAGGVAVAALLVGTLLWLSMAPRATVEAFVQHVGKGDREAALAHIAETVRLRLGDETVWRVALGMELDDVERVSWRGAGVFSGQRRLWGDLHRTDASRQPFEAVLVRETRAWRMLGIFFDSDAAGPPTVPGPGEARTLAHAVSLAVAESLARGDMQPVFAMMDPQAWQESDIETFNSRFPQLLDGSLELDWLHEALPQLAGRPVALAENAIELEGRYASEAGELQFVYQFVAVGSEWKLWSLSLDLGP